jgi:hypothetical protein
MPIRIFVSSGFGSTFGSAAALDDADGALVAPVEPPAHAASSSAAAMVVASQVRLGMDPIAPHLYAATDPDRWSGLARM